MKLNFFIAFDNRHQVLVIEAKGHMLTFCNLSRIMIAAVCGNTINVCRYKHYLN